ncbi:cell surface protein [Siminovitchia terrae]|uniref:Cell surface protein n=1 Tax=Siminovitchia terrae TaxID=1914933 RepID=A0ABQ4KQ06_SIMTE|nr:isopeptide-forming domain-containing fimbrial protein [Siminovitchia terrae]GIN94131.1 cell surface protein [Siminovitchia terrae]
MSLAISKRLKAGFKKSIIFFAMILVTLNGMLPSFSTPVQAAEIDITEAIEQPNVSKDIDGEESKEIPKGEDFNYNVIVELPESVSGYESIEILDDLDQHLAVQGTAVLIDEEENDTYKVVVDGQKISLGLTMEELEELAGKEVKLQITTQVKEDAATADEIENVAQIVINDDLIMETNPAVVTPIDLAEKDRAEPDELKEEKDQAEPDELKEEKDQAEPDELKEEKDLAEPDELKEEKDQAEPTASKEDGEKNVESNENPSAEKTAKASVNEVAAAASFNINNTDSYAGVWDSVDPKFRIYQLDGTSTVVLGSVNLTLPTWVAGFNGVAVSKDNFIYIMAYETSGTTPIRRILKINSAGTVVGTFNPTLAPANTPAATMIDNKYYYTVGTTLYYYDVVTNQQGTKALVNNAGAPLSGLGADLVADSDGYLWISQTDNLLQVNPATGGIIRALPVPGLSTQTPDGVRAMSFLVDGRIMITSHGYNELNSRFTVDEDGKLTRLGDIVGIPITSLGIVDLGSAVTPVFEPFPPILESDKAVKIAQKGLGNRVNQISDQIQTGDTLTYTIRVRNTKAAPSILKRLSITDTLPAGVEYVPGTLMIDNQSMSDSPNDDNGEFVNGTVTGNIGDVIDTNYHTLTFQVKVLPGYENSSILNTATVDADNADPQNPTAEFVVEPGNADMTLEKTVDHDTAYVGDTLTYTLTASNSSTGGAWNGTIADNLPEGVELVSGTTQLNGTALADDDVWTDSQLSVQDVALKAGEKATVTFQVKVLDSVVNETISNVATADDPSDSDDPIDSNEVKTSILYKDPVLQSEKSSKIETKASGNTDADHPEVGDTLLYTIKTKNTIENSLVKNLAITDTIPTGLEYVIGSLQVDGVAVTDAKDTDEGHYADGIVTGEYGDITDTEWHTVTFKVKVQAGQAGADIKNIAEVTGENVEEPGKPEEVVKIYPRAPVLESEKSAVNLDKDKKKFEVGDTVVYTIITRNKVTDSEVKNLTISDKLPVGLEYVENSLEVSHNGTGTFNNGTVAAVFGDVTDTEWRTVTFKAKIMSGQSGKEIKNIAEATGENVEEPGKPEENIKVDPKDPKLESEKAAQLKEKADGNKDANNPEVGDTLLYTIKAKNTIEDSLVKNLVITDALPQGLEYLPGSMKVDGVAVTDAKDTDKGHYADGIVTGEYGDITDTEWHTLTFEVKVQAGQAGADIKNMAEVTGENVEEPGKPEEEVKIYPREPKLDSKKSSKLEEKAEGNTDAKNPEVGDTIRYTITTKNTIEDSLVKNLVITDTIPAGLSYVAGSLEVEGESVTDAKDDDAGHVVDGKVTGNLGDVTDTKERTISFLVTVDKGQSGKDIKNIAVVGGENTEDPDEPEEEVKIYPREPKLDSKKSSKLEKKAEGNTDAKNPEVGDTIRYTITTKNTNEDSLVKNLVITDMIPSGLSYVAGSLEVEGESVTDAKDDDAGHVVDGKVTGNFGDVTDTKKHTVTFLVTIDKGQSGKDIKNIAVVGGENTEDPDEPEEEVKIYPREPKLDSKKSSKLEKKAEGNTDAKNPEVGDTIRYTITTKNTIEDSLVKNLVITDTIPAGLSYVAGSLEVEGESVTDAKDDDAGHVVDGKVTGNFGDVTDTKDHTVSFLVTIDKGQSGKDIKNIAVVGGENTEDPDEPEEEVKIYPREPKLDSKKSSKLEKKAEGNTDAKNPEVGDTIRYTITTKNTIEDSLVENLVISDTIPSGLSYIAGSLEVEDESVTDAKDDDAGHVVDGKVTGNFGDVTDTKERTVSFLVTVDKGQSGKDIKNIAVVGGENTEDPDEPEEEVKIYPREPKLDSKKSSKLEKKAEGNTDAKNPEVGDTIRYTITTKNTIEDSLVKNLVITDMIPSGLSYVAGSLEVDGESVTDAKDDDAGHVVDGKVTGNFGDVTDTKAHTVSFLVTVDKGQPGKDIKNIAVVGGENTEDPDEPEEEVKIYPREPKLESKKSATNAEKGKEKFEVGDTIVYTIKTRNKVSDSLVSNLTIEDTLPAGLELIADSLKASHGGTVEENNGVITAKFGEVTDTEWRTVTFEATIKSGKSGKDIKNTAKVTVDEIEEPEEPTTTVKVDPKEPKLDSKKSSKLEKKAEGNTDAKNPEVGDTIRYTITTKNTIEDSLIEKLVITDTIPSGLSYVAGSLEVDGQSVTDEKDDDAGHVVDGKVTGNFGDVTDTKERTVSFLVTVDKGQSGKDIKNIAVVGGENTEDPDEPEEEVKIYPREPKLDSKKSSKLEKKAEGNTDAKNPEVGDTIRYTITTKNTIEDSLVENLVITDMIPSGLSYVAGSLEVDGQSVTDAKDDDAGQVVDGKVTGNFGDVTDTKAHTVSFLVTVDKGQSGKDIKNIAVVGGENTGDPDEPEEEVKIYPREPKLESKKSSKLEKKAEGNTDAKNPEVGDTIRYTITTKNTIEDSLVKNLVISDTIPSGLSYVTGSLEVDGQSVTDAKDDDAGHVVDGKVTGNFGDVTDTKAHTVSFLVTVDKGQSGKDIKNIAVVGGENTGDPDEPEEEVKIYPREPKLDSKKSSKLEKKAEGNTDAKNPEVGDTIRYTITTKNTIEDSLVENLVVTDTIPAGLSYVAGSLEVDGQSVTDAKDDDAGHVVDGKVTGNFGNVTDTKEHTVTFLVTVDKGQSGKDIKNIAVVGGENTGDPDEPEEEVKIYPREPKLESEKSATDAEKGKEKFEVGNTIVYTIKTRNKVSDSLVQNLTITDKLPASLEYVADSLKVSHEGTGNFKGGTITANFGDVKDTEWRTVTFQAKIKSGQSGKELKNIAVVDGDNIDKPDEPEEKVTVDPKDPTLQSEKSAKLEAKADGNKDKDNPEVGDTLLYTIKTKNKIEDSLVKNLVISDEIPEGLEYVAGSLKVDGQSVTDAKDDDKGYAVDGKIVGQFGNIKDTNWHTVEFLVKVKTGQSGKDIKNIATVDGDNIDKPDKPEEEVQIYPRHSVLESEKSASNLEKGKETFEVGDTIVYTIKTRNKVSDSLVQNLTITDKLPAGLEYVADSLKVSHEGVGEFKDGTITANFGDVKDTEWRTVTFQAKIKSGQSGHTIENIAIVDGDNIDEPDEPSEKVTVDPKNPTLQSEKSARLEAKAEGNKDKEHSEVGDTLRYTIKTQNTIEDSIVKNLVISDEIPEGLEYVADSLKVDGQSVTDAKDDDKGYALDGKIVGQFGNIKDTNWHTVEFLVKVKSGQAGKDIKNIAVVDGDNIDKPDKPEEVVQVYPRHSVLESEKLAMNLEKGKDTFKVGDTVVYTIKARNTVSDSLVENLKITDKLPAGLEYVDGSLEVSHEGTGEFKDGTITANFGDVKDTEWRTVTFKAKIQSGQFGESIKNIAEVSGDNVPDPNHPEVKIEVEPKDPTPTPEEPKDPEPTPGEPKDPTPKPEPKPDPDPGVDNSGGKTPPPKTEKEEGKKLPNTATNIFNYGLLGVIIVLAGLLGLRRRKSGRD